MHMLPSCIAPYIFGYLKLLDLQAVLGGTVTIPTLTGNVSVKVAVHGPLS